MANYDWLQQYASASSGVFGDKTQEMMNYLLTNNANSKELLASGAIRAPQMSTAPTGQYESGYQGQQAGGLDTSQPYVDWSKLPRMGPGGDTPANTMWGQVNSNSRVDPYTMKPVGPDPRMGRTYNDPNYGLLQLIQRRAPDDNVMKYGKMATIALVTSGMASALAPFLVSGLGLGAGANPLMAAFLKALPGLAQGGYRNPLAAVGSIAGGATGIPGGSMLGGAAGSYLGRPGR
jgi:hypothetical protein